MTDYTALKAELQRYAPLVPLCADALAAIEELEQRSAAPAQQSLGGETSSRPAGGASNADSESLLPHSAAPAPAAERGPHGPVSERFMRHYYGPSGYVKNGEGPEELGPQPAPGFHFDDRGVLVPDAAPQPAPEPVACDREFLGRIVRMEWVAWAKEQPSPKSSWLLPWEELTESEREVDRRIGERLWRMFAGALYAAPQPAQADEALTCSDAREERVGCYRAVRAENRADEARELLREILQRVRAEWPIDLVSRIRAYLARTGGKEER